MNQYRKCAGIMLINHEGLVFLAERNDIKNAWQMPQGGIDDGETPEKAVLRELEEETGITDVTIIKESDRWYSYDFPESAINNFNGKYKGQSQKWFLIRFNGKDSDINLETEEPEFSRWAWVKPDEVISRAVSFKKDIYVKVIKEFRDYIQAI